MKIGYESVLMGMFTITNIVILFFTRNIFTITMLLVSLVSFVLSILLDIRQHKVNKVLEFLKNNEDEWKNIS